MKPAPPEKYHYNRLIRISELTERQMYISASQTIKAESYARTIDPVLICAASCQRPQKRTKRR
jgi:hypothetical protein